MNRILILLLCSITVTANATVFVSGVISSNTTWTKANSPYIVNGNLSVDSGVRLTIQPGVKVMVDSGYAITIDGSLMAIGTTTDSIIFTSSKTSPSRKAWQGISFSLKTRYDTCRLYYCRFEYASTAMLVTDTHWLRTYYSTFRYNITAIRFAGQLHRTSDFYKNLITRNDTGVHVSKQSSWVADLLSDSEVSYNIVGIRQENIDGFDFKGNNINYNVIGYSSRGDRIGSNVNTYIGNILYGVYIVAKSGYIGSINSNLFLYNPTAIYIDSADRGVISHNTIAYSDIGIEENKNYNLGPISIMSLSHNCYIKNTIFNYRQNGVINRTSNMDYWGTTSIAGIDSSIYDFNDNASLGKITYTNIKTNNSTCKIVAPPPPCYPHPDSIIATLTSPTTVSAWWPSVPGAYTYEYYVVPLSATQPASGTFTFDTSFIASNLRPGETYQVCVRTRCLSSPFYSAWVCDTVTTPCDPPAHISIDSVNTTSVIASWDSVANVFGYDYAVNPHPSTPLWGTYTAYDSVYITGLAPGTTYDFCVRTRCFGSSSTWICDTFTTKAVVGIPQIAANETVRIYPNPSHGTFTISLNGYNNATITVFDMTGRMVTSKQMNSHNETINLNNAAKGIYTIRILTTNAVINKRIVIE